MQIEKITNPTLADIEQVIPLLNQIFSAYAGHTPYTAEESIKRLSQSSDPLLLIAKKDSTVVGFALCYQRYPGYFHLWELGVDASFRNQGLASSLYDAIESYAKVGKYKGVTLNTFNRYTHSLRLAIKRGYNIYDLDRSGQFESDPKLMLKLDFNNSTSHE